MTPCACGCGDLTAKVWVPGHDQKAIHERVGRIGTVQEFLTWFDAQVP